MIVVRSQQFAKTSVKNSKPSFLEGPMVVYIVCIYIVYIHLTIMIYQFHYYTCFILIQHIPQTIKALLEHNSPWVFSKNAVTGADQGTIRNSVREELSETSRLLLRCRLEGLTSLGFGWSPRVEKHIQGLHPAKTRIRMSPKKKWASPQKERV